MEPIPRDDGRSDAEVLFVVRKIIGAEVGPNEDMLYVYLVNPDGKKFGPVWHQFLKDGLDEPEMPLFQKFKDQVDAASRAGAAKGNSSPSANSKP